MKSWTVTIDAHQVVGPYVTYELPEMVTVVRATGANRARLGGIVEQHVAAGVAPWKPYVRQSWPHARATLYESAVETMA